MDENARKYIDHWFERIEHKQEQSFLQLHRILEGILKMATALETLTTSVNNLVSAVDAIPPSTTPPSDSTALLALASTVDAQTAKIKALGTTAPGIGPAISSISPNPSSAGSTITIAGTGFGTQGAGSALSFNDVPVTPAFWSDTSITANVPVGSSAGSVTVKVSTANGSSSIGLTLA